MVSKNLESIDCPCGSLGYIIGPHPTPIKWNASQDTKIANLT